MLLERLMVSSMKKVCYVFLKKVFFFISCVRCEFIVTSCSFKLPLPRIQSLCIKQLCGLRIRWRKHLPEKGGCKRCTREDRDRRKMRECKEEEVKREGRNITKRRNVFIQSASLCFFFTSLFHCVSLCSLLSCFVELTSLPSQSQ